MLAKQLKLKCLPLLSPVSSLSKGHSGNTKFVLHNVLGRQYKMASCLRFFRLGFAGNVFLRFYNRTKRDQISVNKLSLRHRYCGFVFQFL